MWRNMALIGILVYNVFTIAVFIWDTKKTNKGVLKQTLICVTLMIIGSAAIWYLSPYKLIGLN